MQAKDERKQAILAILKHEDAAMTSARLAEALAEQGFEASQRTVRLDLHELDEEGLAQRCGRRGSVITEEGRTEADQAQVLSRVGLLSAKIDQLTYGMSFDLALRKGTVVVNVAVVRRAEYDRCASLIEQVFDRGYSMGQLVGLLGPGQRLNDVVIPEDAVGLCTVCSVTINGVLLKHGVPMHSRFGGLLEVRDDKPVRFVEMIMYDGTSVDPLEVFIRSAMTNHIGAATAGTGVIGAGLREFPADSLDLVLALSEQLKAIGLGGLLRVGQPGRPLLDIPISQGRVGTVVTGGLNPIAVFEEAEIRIRSFALSGLLEFNHLFPYTDLPARIRALDA